MAKQVIIANFKEDGYNRVFSTLESAAGVLGIHPSTISRAIAECSDVKGIRFRYGDRMYAVRLKGSAEWRVMTENARRTGYVLYGAPEIRFRNGAVEKVRDITEGWYYGIS